MSEVWELQEQLEAFGEKLRSRLAEPGIQLSGEQVLETHVVETL